VMASSLGIFFIEIKRVAVMRYIIISHASITAVCIHASLQQIVTGQDAGRIGDFHPRF
jgi:hypothetical protein